MKKIKNFFSVLFEILKTFPNAPIYIVVTIFAFTEHLYISIVLLVLLTIQKDVKIKLLNIELSALKNWAKNIQNWAGTVTIESQKTINSVNDVINKHNTLVIMTEDLQHKIYSNGFHKPLSKKSEKPN